METTEINNKKKKNEAAILFLILVPIMVVAIMSVKLIDEVIIKNYAVKISDYVSKNTKERVKDVMRQMVSSGKYSELKRAIAKPSEQTAILNGLVYQIEFIPDDEGSKITIKNIEPEKKDITLFSIKYNGDANFGEFFLYKDSLIKPEDFYQVESNLNYMLDLYVKEKLKLLAEYQEIREKELNELNIERSLSVKGFIETK